ncbi:hypothetical protein [Actinoplanes sp. NPDC051851]|uniref:hypothetical protein n=1 Tax=Actinoplanes sp. NPDC051851 TaxID=3154753 RepID=UPI003421DC5F
MEQAGKPPTGPADDGTDDPQSAAEPPGPQESQTAGEAEPDPEPEAAQTVVLPMTDELARQLKDSVDRARAADGPVVRPATGENPAGATTAGVSRTRRWAWIVAAVMVLTGVALVLPGGGGDGAQNVAATSADPAEALWPSATTVDASAPVSVAATHAARTEDDLDDVCGGTYYPASPKYAGKAPHPIVISARERLDLSGRTTRTLNRAAFAGTAKDRKTWAPSVGRTQLVACLDLLSGGTQVAECTSDDAKPVTLPMKSAKYRLTVYEVRTRREVSTTTLTGGDKSCPWVTITGADHTLYTTVDDDQLYKALRKRAEK